VHHDCEVRLSIGQETVLLGIPSLTSKQLRRSGQKRMRAFACLESLVQDHQVLLHCAVLNAQYASAARSSPQTWVKRHRRSAETSTSWTHTGGRVSKPTGFRIGSVSVGAGFEPPSSILKRFATKRNTTYMSMPT
jgi:hypothetical protein